MAMINKTSAGLKTLAFIAAALFLPGTNAFAGKSNVGVFLGIGGDGGASLGLGYSRHGKHGSFGVGIGLPIARSYDYDYYESPAYYHQPAYYAPPPPVYYAPAPRVATYYEYRGHGGGRHHYHGHSTVGVSVQVPIRVNTTPVPRAPRGSDYIRANAINPVRTRAPQQRAQDRTWVPGHWEDAGGGDRKWIAPGWEYR